MKRLFSFTRKMIFILATAYTLYSKSLYSGFVMFTILMLNFIIGIGLGKYLRIVYEQFKTLRRR